MKAAANMVSFSRVTRVVAACASVAKVSAGWKAAERAAVVGLASTAEAQVSSPLLTSRRASRWSAAWVALAFRVSCACVDVVVAC